MSHAFRTSSDMEALRFRDTLVRVRAGETIVEGDVLNIVVTIGKARACVFSAMALVEKKSARLLWASPELETDIPRFEG